MKLKALFGLFCALLLLVGCATPGPKKIESPDGETVATDSVPKEVDFSSRKIALVLGGAGVASFATVGLIKRFEQEGFRPNAFVVTGWPSTFVLAHGFLKSVHDVEWFSMRLNKKDFFGGGLFNFNRGYASHQSLRDRLSQRFEQNDLRQTRIPTIIGSTNLREPTSEYYDKGDWLRPLLQAMSVPGYYRPYPRSRQSKWIHSLRGVDVDEALRREYEIVIAVDMYEDYFNFLRRSKEKTSEATFRQLYLNQAQKRLSDQMARATITGRIYLRSRPTDFSQKRRAILAGVKEAEKLLGKLKRILQ